MTAKDVNTTATVEGKSPVKVSVIIPVYNAQRTLRMAAESVLKQDFSDFELILVNDCSTDGSIGICRELQKQDSRVVVIDKPKNGGASRARFSGIEVARGEYLTFGDSDDYFLEGALKHLYDTAVEQGCDIVKCNYVKEGRNADSTENRLKKYVGRYDRQGVLDIFRKALLDEEKIFKCLYTVLYRRELFEHDDVKPVDFFWGDDIAVNLQVAQYADSMYVSDRNVYVYAESTGTHHYKYDALGKYVMLSKIETAYVKQYFPNDKESMRRAYWKLYDTTRTYLRYTIEYFRGSREKNIRYFEEVLSDPIFKECFSYFTPEDEIERALFDFDVKRAYRLCEKSLRWQWPKIYLRHFAKWAYFKLH